MYTRPGRQRDVNQSVDAHARSRAVDAHRGDRHDFVRRHERAVNFAIQSGRQGVQAIAPQLLGWIADTRNLRAAWDHLSRFGGAAPGPNLLHYTDLDEREIWNLLRSLSQATLDGTYRSGEDRQVQISKGRGRGFRTLTLQNIEDRIVARGIVQVIQPLLDYRFDDNSYGYRPGRGRLDALAKAERLILENGRSIPVVEDLSNAFDQVPRNRLYDLLGKLLPSEVMRLIEAVSDNGGKHGIRQGSPLSPLLLNVYLDHFLDQVWRRCAPDVPLIRVADDLLLLCQTDTEALEAYERCKNLLTPTGMRLKGVPETAIRNLAAGQRADWLGFKIALGEEGLVVHLAEQAWDKLVVNLEAGHLLSGSQLRASEIIEGWIAQQGPSYAFEDPDQVYARVVSTARELAYEEPPSRNLFLEKWSQANGRWNRLRRAVVEGKERSVCSGGSACHDLSATSRRSDRAFSDVPSQPTSAAEATVYTDGCCLGGSKVGGWACLIRGQGTSKSVFASGGLKRTTSSRAELIAVIEALKSLPAGSRVRLLSDSHYVVKGINVWLDVWKRHGWRAGSSGRLRPLDNCDLWRHLDELLCEHRVVAGYVRSHAGNPFNEKCD